MTTYTITHNYGQCPNQISGTTDDGREFYFRGRGGSWSLGFASTYDEAVGKYDYEGDLLQAGWFELDEWEAVFWDVIENVVEKERPHPTAKANDVATYQQALKKIHDQIHSLGGKYASVVEIIRKNSPREIY